MDEGTAMTTGNHSLPKPDLSDSSSNKLPNPGKTNNKPLNKEVAANVQTAQPAQTDNLRSEILDDVPHKSTANESTASFGNTKQLDSEGAASRSEGENGNVLSLKNKKTCGTFIPLDNIRKKKKLHKVRLYLENERVGSKVVNFSEKPIGKQYRKIHEYKVVKEFKPDVYLVKDTKTNTLHVLKRVSKGLVKMKPQGHTGKVPQAMFDLGEPQAMLDLEDTGKVPGLLMIIVNKETMDLHIEYIFPGLTLKDYGKYADRDSSEKRLAFSLYIYRESLHFIEEMFNRGWKHEDYHHENIYIMVKQKGTTIRLKFLDFGLANKKYEISKHDIRSAFANFCYILVGKRLFLEQEIIKEGDEIQKIYNKIKQILNSAEVGDKISHSNLKKNLSFVCDEFKQSLKINDMTEEQMLENEAKKLTKLEIVNEYKTYQGIEQETATDEKIEVPFNEEDMQEIHDLNPFPHDDPF